MQPKILIVDDHSMIRKGLKLNIQFNLKYTDITEAGTCTELMKELVKKTYTHLILDIILPDGSTLEIMPNISRLFPDLQVMVFSMQPDEVYGEALKHFGIKYYLSKSVGEEELNDCLDKFLNNRITLNDTGSSFTTNPFTLLSQRELEVLHYILKGIGTKQTSDRLNLKMSTISTVKTRILEKIKVSNTKELMELAALFNVNY